MHRIRRFLLLLCALAAAVFCLWLPRRVRTSIRASDAVTVSAYEVIGLQRTEEPHSVTLTADDPLYTEISDLLKNVLWLPSLNQGIVSLGSRSSEFSILYGSAQSDELYLRITVTDSGHCQIDGKNVLALSVHGSGKKLYQALRELVESSLH